MMSGCSDASKLCVQDPGLYLLVPLYRFLRGYCTNEIFSIIVKNFKSCEYFARVVDLQPYRTKDVFNFLNSINNKGKEAQKKKKENPNHLSMQIFNVKDNEEILKNISVGDMLNSDEQQCISIRNLDLHFLLNILTNFILEYPLSESAIKAVDEVKDIRNGLHHSKYEFSKGDFNKCIERLQKAFKEIFSNFSISDHDLDEKIEECRGEIDSSEPLEHLKKIYSELQEEIHGKYKSPHNFVCPTIREDGGNETASHECLEMHLQDPNSKPILLCGKRESEKQSILQNQAYQLVQKLNAQDQGDKRHFSLIVLLEENPQNKQALRKDNFWEYITKSMENMAPKTVSRYGIQIVLTAMKMHIEKIIFLVNWTLQNIMVQFTETSNGTWVFTYHGYPGKSSDWKILNTEPLKDTQVCKMLQSLNPKESELELYEKYKECNFKDTLSTPGMVKIFNELHSIETEFELMIKYVEKKKSEGKIENKDITTIGKLAFDGIEKGKQKFSFEEVKEISERGRLIFFTRDRDYFELIHNTLMDFFAAVYVIENLDKACNQWLKNTIIFKRVFKFVCSFWFRDVRHCWNETVKRNVNKNIYLIKMKEFLCEFLKMEVNENTPESMEVVVSDIKEKERQNTGDSVKNPFNKWGFLDHIDEACEGRGQVLEMIADILSNIKCWVFKCKELDDLKLKRVHKILKKVKLSQSSPVIIKIESGPSCNMLKNIWTMLKNTESLHNSVEVNISIMHEKKDGKCQIMDNKLKELFCGILNTRAPVHIIKLSMPVISEKIPNFKFSNCECIKKLEYLDVSVYDVNSLREVLDCGSLPNMKSIKIHVDFKGTRTDQRIENPPQLKLPNPNNRNVNITIVYFKGIQKLLDAFTCRHRLFSLSIHGIVVDGNFKLDMSAFKNMESLYLHCNTTHTAPFKHDECASLFSENLTLPKNLDKLLLSGVEFYNEDNIHFLRNFISKCNIQRLMILDSNLSLNGARMFLKHNVCQETETECKRMKIDRSDSIYELVKKKPRLSKEDRSINQENKPEGKEIIITSNTELKYSSCSSKPCQCMIQCTSILDPSETTKQEFKDLSDLIDDAYGSSIISFAFSNKNVIVRKDRCNDLRVHCPLFKIEDDDIYKIQENEIPSNSPISQLFQSLTLIQSLYIENTALSYNGIMALVRTMKKNKGKRSQDDLVEPFSLTVTSDHLPCKNLHGVSSELRYSEIFEFMKQKNCLQMLNIWCTCDILCHKVKKTHDGDIFVNDIKEYKAPRVIRK